MKKVRNKWWIQNTIYYLIKWVDWSFEYNFYKSVSHLVDVLKAVTDYECRFKQKHKKISQINIDKVLNSENASCKWMSRWSHVLYLIHSVLNEILKSCVFHFICSRILTDFWVNYTTSHSVSYFFYSQLQLIHQIVETCCVKSKKCFTENWY